MVSPCFLNPRITSRGFTLLTTPWTSIYLRRRSALSHGGDHNDKGSIVVLVFTLLAFICSKKEANSVSAEQQKRVSPMSVCWFFRNCARRHLAICISAVHRMRCRRDRYSHVLGCRIDALFRISKQRNRGLVMSVFWSLHLRRRLFSFLYLL